MSAKKLRNHIAIGAPARRAAADGTESDMRVSLGFVPGFYTERCNVDFSKEWHKDPYYRHETLVNMKKTLKQTFPSATYWDKENYNDALWTLSGVFGAYVIPKVYGFSLQYEADRWPDIPQETERLTLKEMNTISVEDFTSSPALDNIFNQMDIIEKKRGQIPGYLNWQGVLNNALHLRGEDIFTDFYGHPDEAHHLLSVLANAMIEIAKTVQKRQRQSGFYVDHFVVSNCYVNMISPEMYKEFIFPYDKRISGEFERFGVHTCDWDVTPYLDELRKLPKVGYLDMGPMSDMKKAKEYFPNARRAVIYHPEKLYRASSQELKEDMNKIYQDIAPCDFVMADIRKETPDERVKELLEICRALEGEGSKKDKR